MTYWINTVSADHVQRGVTGGFTQANHGKPHMLRKMAKDDWIVFYSPKTAFEGGEPLQAFTAIGRITDDEPYQVEMAPGFSPWRRDVEFRPCVTTSIHPLLSRLEFIADPQRWGYTFRFGVFRIGEPDFQLIRSAMTQPVAA